MSTFVLVHGAWHGAWCWDRLVPELEAHGHRTIAMDLPSDDEGMTFDGYADAVCATLRGAGEDIVLVGHSLAGHTIPLVAARRPVKRLVYLCSLVPQPGRSLRDQLGEDLEMLFPRYLDGIGARTSAVGEPGTTRRSPGMCCTPTATPRPRVRRSTGCGHRH